MHARFLPKFIAATAFGEINGVVTERIENLAILFKTAKLPYVIKKDMQAYLITHSVSDIAMLSYPPMLKMVLKFPNLFLDLFFMTWLRTKMVRDMMLPDYANNANNEIVQLSNDLMKFLSQHDIKSEIHVQ
ncbi:hypothetical protein NYE25_04835 [Paenibacillus sp. FSL E2-8871]|uniref:hypothetical protein n=1 Tax=Paenibacillus sp. FSL E2-8871 TaxID=2975326 RepID=UPI0030FC359F